MDNVCIKDTKFYSNVRISKTELFMKIYLKRVKQFGEVVSML